MEDYYQDKKQKRNDFLLGFLLNLGVGVVAFGLSWLAFSLVMAEQGASLEGTFSRNLMKGIGLSVLILLFVIPEFILIRKHLKGRRYIAIGMISSIIIPLFIVGACTPFILFI